MQLALPSPLDTTAPKPPSQGLVRRAQLTGSAAVALAPLPLAALTVGRDDDMETLHAQLERAATRCVTLAIAPDARLLQRPLEFGVLRRLAEELSLDLSIATDDPDRRRLAREFGFALEAPRGRPRAWRPRARRLGSGVAALALLGGS